MNQFFEFPAIMYEKKKRGLLLHYLTKPIFTGNLKDWNNTNYLVINVDYGWWENVEKVSES